MSILNNNKSVCEFFPEVLGIFDFLESSSLVVENANTTPPSPAHGTPTWKHPGDVMGTFWQNPQSAKRKLQHLPLLCHISVTETQPQRWMQQGGGQATKGCLTKMPHNPINWVALNLPPVDALCFICTVDQLRRWVIFNYLSRNM